MKTIKFIFSMLLMTIVLCSAIPEAKANVINTEQGITLAANDNIIVPAAELQTDLLFEMQTFTSTRLCNFDIAAGTNEKLTNSDPQFLHFAHNSILNNNALELCPKEKQDFLGPFKFLINDNANFNLTNQQGLYRTLTLSFKWFVIRNKTAGIAMRPLLISRQI